ncbi:ABC transporter substrate-binding protein [Streptomyces sp. NPDC004647]|uniref:ABC transporter substrate-binding protein n=1 Tax=Streptomyces sp. NPDC004647 TaxID=3154671 RepID=UPI0033A886B2
MSNRPLWARWPWNALSGIALLTLVGSFLVWSLQPVDTSCAQGVERVGGGDPEQCVGLTDGSYRFTDGTEKTGDNLTAVSELIRKENERVDKAHKKGTSYVSLVYLMPLLPTDQDTNTPHSVRHELQGAYTAQYQANHTSWYGSTPKVKLLLANSGINEKQRDTALKRIEERIPKDNIVAVAGLGTSTAATEKMIRRITKDGKQGGLHLAAVSSVLTADTLSRINGLAQVAPTNGDQAAAAAAYLQRKEYAGKRVLVIQDDRPGDQYTRTLGKAFRDALPRDRLVRRVERYDSSQEGVGTAFKLRIGRLCAAKPDIIYFAGRGVDLPEFLSPLADHSCGGRELVVFSGDDVSQSAAHEGFKEIKQTLNRGKVRLFYTGLAHQGAWQERASAYPGLAVTSFGPKGRYRSDFSDETLDDGQAIMGHDAVLTALSGARLVADRAEESGQVTGSRVIQVWNVLGGSDHAVRGASGLIALENDGSPERKAVPIIEIKKDGTVHTLDVSAASGDPLTEGSLASPDENAG